jgi:hypothetical protein
MILDFHNKNKRVNLEEEEGEYSIGMRDFQQEWN